ncbi:CAF17-like 4Fe-4S cluster assembly/insertion protein YgfZ [Caenimonas aquaedulcis]|uniref:Folate-binding protein YgfZ n=1 Tax=Caenimonas aquaedulcis TaxID=2793270 RepID=A0A931H1P5_9BURK|nr:folate-binding protein YgfZ [Caenimonas aquaedulcis]MBG9386937.1 folate-binding protein YgfZ [Caenimonas aquaedulcis]
MTDALNGVTPLSHLGVIVVEGDDAATFLQGQMTQDFALLDMAHARLSAYCTAKGRMQASFIGIRTAPTAFLLVMSRDILAPTLKRLSMFVLRAKARLRDATPDHALYGVAGDAVTRNLPAAGEPWDRMDIGPASFVRLYPADGQARALAIAPAGSAPPEGATMDESRWQWGDVRAGVATITAPIVEALVPQMLNYESVGGVNFKKGCYPGQEVVARSQFRGTLKRRAWLAHGDAPMSVGQELFHDSDAEQPCGVIAQAAAAPAGGWDAIVSLQLAATAGGAVTLGAPDGPRLLLQPPPYPLLADV